MSQRRKQSQAGFTIVELTLAMVFVAFILIFTALTIVQMLRTYDKAISMKQINQAGRTITDDVSRVMRAQLPTTVDTSQVSAGLFCVGTTVYQWNPLFPGTPLASSNPVPGNANAISGPATTGPMMIKKTRTNQNGPCTPGEVNNPANIVAGSESALLSHRTRVIWADAQSNSGGRLVTLTFIIGTHNRDEVDDAPERAQLVNGGGTGNYSNFTMTPHREITGGNAKITCLSGNNGNYCAFAEFKTVVYVSKDAR